MGSLVIDKDHRGKGLATKIFKVMEQIAKARGFKGMLTLPTSPRTDVIVYNKLGYKLVSQVLYEEYYVMNLSLHHKTHLLEQWGKDKPRMTLAIKSIQWKMRF